MVSIYHSFFYLHIYDYSFSKSKRVASNPSQVKTFSIDSIMRHNQETSIEPINTSSSKFGVFYENQFVVLDDAKHVIGVDARDGRSLIIENLKNGKADKFLLSQSFHLFKTLVYDEKTGFLYSGGIDGHLHKYKINKASKLFQRVIDYGDLRIGLVISSHRFLDFVFFGGDRGRIRVLNLLTGELLPGSLETSIWYIYSLHVCVKSHDEIYLTVSGGESDYSDDKTDLFDVSGLFLNNPVMLQKYLSENLINDGEATLFQSSIIENQAETAQELFKKKDLYKAELNEMHLKYNHLKKKNDQLQNNKYMIKNKKLIPAKKKKKPKKKKNNKKKKK